MGYNKASQVIIARDSDVRYSRLYFPEDLTFQETANRQNFQGRYIIQHPFEREMECEAAEEYKKNLQKRQDKEIETLAKLTGWDLEKIQEKFGSAKTEPEPWWRSIWD